MTPPDRSDSSPRQPTSYVDFDVPALWRLLQSEGSGETWRQVSGWRRTYELLCYHAAELERCRRELAEAWPPERSPASHAFVTQLDGMLFSLKQAQAAATTNADMLAAVLSSLWSAKTDISKLKAEWDRNEAEAQRRGQPGQINIFAHSGGSDWRIRLNEQARIRMEKADAEVFEATRMMSVPISYQLRPTIDGGGVGKLGPVGGAAPAAMTPPVIPPPTQMRDDSLPVLAAGIGGSAGAHSFLVDTPSGVALPTGGVIGAAHGIGPVPSAGYFSERSAKSTSGVVGTPNVAGAVKQKGANAVGVGATGTRPAIAPAVNGATRAAAANSGGAGRASPASGIVNGAGSKSIATTQPLLAGPRGAKREHANGEARDPDTIWSVREGVSPVIEPGPEIYQHDPGPGIIGIDR
jgi:hypothetical protein